MPRTSIIVDLSDIDDIQNMIDLLNCWKKAVGITMITKQAEADPSMAPAANGGISEAPSASSPAPTAEASAGSGDTSGPTATTAASPSEEGRKTRVKKPPNDIVVFDGAGEKLAGYSHSKDAADRFVIEWRKTTSREEMDAIQSANLTSMARLAKEDMERILPLLAEHSTKVKAGTLAPPPATPEEANLDDQLAAAFGAPAPAEPEPAPRAMDYDQFVKTMLGIARQLGGQEAREFLRGQGFEDIKGLPEDKWAGLIAAGEARVKELAAKAA